MKLKTLIFCSALTICSALSAQVVVNIDTSLRGPKVSPNHYGIFYEDINHAADGGIYAELIRNRSFEDDTMPQRRGRRRDGEPNRDGRITGWQSVGNATISLVQANLLNSVQHNALNVNVTKEGDGIRNEGFWGINAVDGRKYKLSFWARSDKKYKGTLSASLRNEDGSLAYGHVKVSVNLGPQWKKYTAEFTATSSNPKAVFHLVADKAGEFQLDVVSLFPPTFKGHENGMRPDLAEMLAAMHPRFMRFPGGCFVEGQDSPDNAFRWKRTIGPIEEREGHPNVNWGYRTSDGLGYHEYLQLAEDLGAKPLFVVNVGIWHGGCDPYNQIDKWIEECLDALEYANGDVTTKYGKMRADNGHPEPFNLEFIEIGNENYNFHFDNNSDQSDHYPERYIQFYNAIKAKYPNVKCIGNVESWGTDEPSWRNEHPVDLVDEHYYRNPKWFADRFYKYDSYPRGTHQVYVGEYAVTSMFGEIGNLNAALGEAVYMMGMENNSDVVAMNSYAPIFVNENDARWRPDMIRFNSSKVMGTPSYYVQQLFPNNIGTQVVKTSWTYNLTEPEAVKKEAEKPVQIGLASWGTTVHYKDAKLTIGNENISLDDFSKWTGLTGEWKAENGEMIQTSGEQPSMILCPQMISEKKYSYSIKAKKDFGPEGFMLMFGYKDKNNYSWYNVGGWGNTQNNIEQGLGGGRVQLGKDRRFKVEDGRWYDIRVDVDGDSIFAYLDGNLEFACQQQRGSQMKGVYATTTIDDATKTMYVKIANIGDGKAPGTINLKNCQVNTAASDAITLIRLASASGEDENTLDNPRNIYPKTSNIKASADNKIDFDVPPFSINIIKVKLK